MRLYYSPLACSLAAHIACREAGLEVELVRVDLPTKRTANGGDLFAENPMGQVPTLKLEGGRTLTESVAVLSYLGDRVAKDAEGENDVYERTRWLSFVSTEIHKKVLWPIFAQSSPEEVKAYARVSAKRGLEVVAQRLGAGEALVGDAFTVADAYLFWALMLMPHAGIDLEPFPGLGRFQAKHGKRESVRAALAFEREEYGTAFAMT